MALQVLYYAYGVYVKTSEGLTGPYSGDSGYPPSDNTQITLIIERLVYDDQTGEVKDRNIVFDGHKQVSNDWRPTVGDGKTIESSNLFGFSIELATTELAKKALADQIWQYSKITTSEKDLFEKMIVNIDWWDININFGLNPPLFENNDEIRKKYLKILESQISSSFRYESKYGNVGSFKIGLANYWTNRVGWKKYSKLNNDSDITLEKIIKVIIDQNTTQTSQNTTPSTVTVDPTTASSAAATTTAVNNAQTGTTTNVTNAAGSTQAAIQGTAQSAAQGAINNVQATAQNAVNNAQATAQNAVNDAKKKAQEAKARVEKLKEDAKKKREELKKKREELRKKREELRKQGLGKTITGKDAINAALAIILPILRNFINTEKIVNKIIEKLINDTKKTLNPLGRVEVQSGNIVFTPRNPGNYDIYKTNFDRKINTLKTSINTLKTIVDSLNVVLSIIRAGLAASKVYLIVLKAKNKKNAAISTPELASPLPAKPNASKYVITKEINEENFKKAENKIDKWTSIVTVLTSVLKIAKKLIDDIQLKINALSFTISLSPATVVLNPTPNQVLNETFSKDTSYEAEYVGPVSGRLYKIKVVKLLNESLQAVAYDSFSTLKITQTAPSKFRTSDELIEELKQILE